MSRRPGRLEVRAVVTDPVVANKILAAMSHVAARAPPSVPSVVVDVAYA